MTSSLVGSEMCIRDRRRAPPAFRPRPLVPTGRLRVALSRLLADGPVSYTHLTLPTSVDLGGR
eukprot:121426-Prorocentrum_lima.AAC.1